MKRRKEKKMAKILMILKCAAPGVVTNFHVGITAIPIMIAITICAMCARPDKNV